MIAAFFSPDRTERKAFIEEFVAQCGAKTVIHICPANIVWQADSRNHVFAFEDITKTDPWLTLNNLIGQGAALIMEGVSRYPKITSEKVLYLQRLSMQVEHRAVVDLVPFTMGIEYLYTPYSYLDRSILGFAHWYAFEKRNTEMNEEGQIFDSHDPAYLATKVKKVTRTTKVTPLLKRHVIAAPCTNTELTQYDEMKEKVFAEEESPQRLVTRLGDFVHAYKSRKEALMAELPNISGRAIIICNLNSYSAKIQKLIDKAGMAHLATSYKLASERTDLASFDHIVYMESPIVKGYYVFDIEAQLKRDAEAWTVLGDTKVDHYLFDRSKSEIEAVQVFMQHQVERTNNG